MNRNSDCRKNDFFDPSVTIDSAGTICPIGQADSAAEPKTGLAASRHDDILNTDGTFFETQIAEVPTAPWLAIDNIAKTLPTEYQDLYQTDPQTSLRPKPTRTDASANTTSIRPRSIRSADEIAAQPNA